MMNKVMLIGNLGRDPEIRYTNSGAQVTNFNVATSEKWKDEAGNLNEKTTWHRVVAFGRLAEICGNLLQKGSMVYVDGKIQERKWQDQNGNDRYSVEIVAREVRLLKGGKEQKETGGNDYSPPPVGSEDVPF